MQDALTAWIDSARVEVTLKSGTKVTIHRPDLQDQIISGEVSLPVLDKMAKTLEGKGTTTPEDIGHLRDVQRRLIIGMVDEVEGQTFVLTEAQVDALPVSDRMQLIAYAMGEEEFPFPNGKSHVDA